MHDPWNPSHTEVREWAFDAEALEPDQDWDLGLAHCRQHERLYIELAGDASCPKREYFLALLYLMVGNAVRSDFRAVAKPLVEAFQQLGADSTAPDVQTWVRRSWDLLRAPDTFDYDSWCAGKLARER